MAARAPESIVLSENEVAPWELLKIKMTLSFGIFQGIYSSFSRIYMHPKL